MKPKTSPYWGDFRYLIICLPFWLVSIARAEQDIPAILQFAEQYSSQKTDEWQAQVKEKVPAIKQQKRTKESEYFTLRQALKQREARLAHMQTTLDAQSKQLTLLRQALKDAKGSLRERAMPPPLSDSAKPAEFVNLRKLLKKFRETLRDLSDSQRETALMAQAQQRAELQALKAERDEKMQAFSLLQQKWQTAEQQRRALETRLTALQDMQQAWKDKQETREEALTALNTRLAELEKENHTQKESLAHKDLALRSLQDEKNGLQTQQAALKKQINAADERLAKQNQDVLRLQDDIKGLSGRAHEVVKLKNLQHPIEQQAYAAGTALGRDIVDMLETRKEWGVKADRQTVLAGVIDAFSGQYQLSNDQLTKALAESEAIVNKALKKASVSQAEKNDAFVANFTSQKTVRQSASGFWYRIDYKGDKSISSDAIVDVVVKESLTDGTVIQDMELAGNVLSQPLHAYPPLFREAISHLRNHGSLTMVVPPELAYGEEGYPPKVPPNATMVYELRIDGIKTTAPL